MHELHESAREVALSIYHEVLDVVRADRVVRDSVKLAAGQLFIQDTRLDLSQFDRVMVCGAGKASVKMASALVEILGDHVTDGLVVTKEGQAQTIHRLTTIESSHPIPDQRSIDAGEAMLAFGASLKPRDLVLFVLSGGASALMEAPVEGVSLLDLQAVNVLLLAAGAPIEEVNQVRKALSRVKGGGLARAFGEATVMVMVLSDVIGNQLASIGSGPFFPGKSIRLLAEEVLHKYSLSDRVSPAVLLACRGHRPPQSNFAPNHFVLGSLALAMHAVGEACRTRGIEPLGFADPMKGEARLMANQIGKVVRKIQAARPDSAWCAYFGGESTVTLGENPGLGGRSQEMAVAFAPLIAKMPSVAAVFAGTDGFDGPTDAAGGVVDWSSVNRAKTAGFSVTKTLRDHNSYDFLTACDGLIKTGPTHSNVNDLAIIVNLPFGSASR